MKHAYLIMAHNNPRILRVLLEMIDDERNDIFLHVDSKSDLLERNTFATKHAQLHVLEKRKNVNWGGVTQIYAELLLFETALKNGPYSYYHLISGVDLPIKSQDYIHRFFDEHQGKEFIRYQKGIDNNSKMIKERVGRYWVMEKYFRTGNVLMKAIREVMNTIIGVVPRKLDMDFRKGTNWVSLTEKAVKYMIENKEKIYSRYKHTRATDEVYKHTLIYENPELYNNVYDLSESWEACMREIDWKRGNPYVWTIKDKEILKNSPCLFARKFSEKDMEIVEWVRTKYIK